MSVTETASTSALIPTYATYPFELVDGSGMRVRDAAGNSYLDFYGGHAVATLGHSPAGLAAALSQQASTFHFYSNVARIPVREEAARALVDFAGPPFTQVFFCNSGTEANEAALKVAIQASGHKRIAALKGAFHGRTLLSLSATAGAGYRAGVEELLVPCAHLEPNDIGALASLDRSIAAMIVEPVQSMAGVVSLTREYLQALRAITKELGITLIFDEVQTGVGRMGAPFAANHVGVTPDLITTAKGLGAGFPVGAVIFSKDMAAHMKEGDLGSTFGGGPLAAAAVLSTLNAIQSQALLAQVRRVSAAAMERLCVGPVHEVLGEGWLMGLKTHKPARSLHQYLMNQRILTGTSANPHVLRLLPPLIAEEEHVEELREALLNFKGNA